MELQRAMVMNWQSVPQKLGCRFAGVPGGGGRAGPARLHLLPCKSVAEEGKSVGFAPGPCPKGPGGALGRTLVGPS